MTSDRLLSQVGKMRGLILDIALLNENLLQLKGDIAIQSAARMEAKAHQILGEIQQVLSAPQGESQADHVIAISGSGELIIRESTTLPTGSYHLSDFDHENLIEAIAAATEPLPFSEPLDLFETAPPSNGAAIVGGSNDW